ncbi:E3 ubiquitin-protein ligase siah-1-like [Triticum dicoccoides]|uniref:E3 ubiquitin-protein ligase siah-1-like n=1 Tax=Triticum dicoccoides TaxID=85692 RepID=UPI00162B843F|nr:E3 ubiquitin-protein ligase siah-1-like [Triticum dicoccoides]
MVADLRQKSSAVCTPICCPEPPHPPPLLPPPSCRIPLPLLCAGNTMVRTRGGKENWVLPPDAVQLKEEDGETAATVMVATAAAAAAPRVEIVVDFDKSLLDCPLCSLPLKPPVFQCPAKHAACGPCTANQANQCPACDGAYERDEGADRYLLAVRVPCPNQAYGCGSSVVYCMAGDHRLVCPHAPCRCPEPGCGFLGAPPALRLHLAERHAWPVTDIAYGSVLEIQMQGRRLLSAEGGERLFLLVASERGVKVVRVSAAVDEDGPSASWYRCKVWVHAPVDTDTGHMDVLMLDAKVESCAVPSEEAAMSAGGRYLPVPSDVPAPDGGGIVLRLRIDKQVTASRSPRSRA